MTWRTEERRTDRERERQRVTPPLGARAPAYDPEYYTPTLCLAMWLALVDTRGLRPSLVRPNHLAAPYPPRIVGEPTPTRGEPSRIDF
jgi:hypothetical protein